MKTEWRGAGNQETDLKSTKPSLSITTPGSLKAPRDPMVRRLGVEPLAGDFALPAPIDQGAFLALGIHKESSADPYTARGSAETMETSRYR